MKNLKTIFLLISFVFLCGITIAQQKSTKLPSLDDGKVIQAKLKPDPEQKEILSAYLKGKTTSDTLRIKVKGTTMLQNVGITILSLDKKNELNFEIAKENWKNIARNGNTSNGFYQTFFQTGGDFGIAIYSNKKGVPFNVIIWTSDELKPKTDDLFVSIEEYNKLNKTNLATASSSNNEKEQEASIDNFQKKENQKPNTNFFNYVIVAVLVIIAMLLFALLKKKKLTNLGVFLIFFMISQYSFSQISQSDMDEIKANLSYFPGSNNVVRIAEFFNEGKDGKSNYDMLTKQDTDYQPNIDPKGQPKLPSSCKKSKNNQKRKNSRRRNPTNSNQTNQDNNDTAIDSPKYDSNGNPINNNTETTSQNDNPFTDDGTVVSRNDTDTNYKKDENGNLIEEDVIDRPKYDNDGNPIEYDANGRPKFDRNDNYIDYDNSNRPKFDSDGQTIDYPIENENTIYNINGRPRFDRQKKEIHYDNVQHPNYDRHGNLIAYINVENDEDSSQNETSSQNESASSDNPSNSDINVDVTNKKNEFEGANQNNATRNRNYNPSNDEEPTDNDFDNSDGCKCLKNAYADLENLRYKFEKLRIILLLTEKITKYAISFGDDVSPLTGGIGGLAWQKERLKILKGMKKFYKAYDNKYNQFVNDLNSILKQIDKCENKLEFESWYDKVGFIYYEFMKDKYKRT